MHDGRVQQHWYEALILDAKEKDVFVHYMGWGDKYNEWIPRDSDRIQVLHSETGTCLAAKTYTSRLCMDYPQVTGGTSCAWTIQ
jgi:hypothetical protein